METFLQFPATISVVTLLSLIVGISLMSVLFLHLIKFLINEKAWNKEIIDAHKVMDFFVGLVRDQGSYKVWRHEHKEYILQKTDTGEWFFNDPLYTYGYLVMNEKGTHRRGDSYMSSYVNTFKTKQEAEDFIKLPCETHYDYKIRFDKLALLLLAPAFDIALMFFKMNPVATISVILTAALIWGTRWISGKLAYNVNKTNEHEERITKLEEK